MEIEGPVMMASVGSCFGSVALARLLPRYGRVVLPLLEEARVVVEARVTTAAAAAAALLMMSMMMVRAPWETTLSPLFRI